MKVICIDDKFRNGDIDYSTSFRLNEGETYTVVRTETAYGSDRRASLCYVLYEDLFSNQAHEVSRFLPLSEIDETELIKQREQLCTL